MTKEQIRAAAINAANEVYGREECIEWEHLVFAFRDGAEWRINSVWHKSHDIPEVGKDCLIEYADGDGCAHIRIDRRSEYEWVEACHYDRILRWAYIDDLIPTEDETA